MKPIEGKMKSKVLCLLKSGKSVREIAKLCDISHMTVFRISKNCEIDISFHTRGRRRKLTDPESRCMAKLVTSGTARTPKEAAASIGKNVSEWTARRCLERIGLEASVRKKRPALSARNIKARRSFGERHKFWTVEDWKRVIWYFYSIIILTVEYIWNNFR